MSKKVKLPKHVAGVKVPKPWRKAAEAALEELASPAGREVAAGALAAAAATLAGAAAAKAAEATSGAGAESGARSRGPDVGALLGLAATAAMARLRAAQDKAEGGGS